MNYINKIYLKEIEELKQKNLVLSGSNNYNEHWFKHWYEENKKSQKQVEELKEEIKKLKQQQKQYTTQLASIEQLEYIQKALNKNNNIDIKFIKCSVETLINSMKYNKLCESHKN